MAKRPVDTEKKVEELYKKYVGDEYRKEYVKESIEYKIFKKYKISVDMITTSEVSISLTVDNVRNLEPAVEELKKFARVSVIRRRAIVCVVGEGMKRVRAMAGRIFSCLSREDINVEMISQGASEINISFLVHEQEVKKAVRALHRDFFGK